MRKTVLIATVLTTLAATSTAASAAVLEPAHTDEVMIDVLAVAGCPVDSVKVAISPDNASFRLWFDTFQVHIGPDARPTDARRTCQIVFSIHVPQGAAYAIDRMEYGGYASIAPGAVFTQRARHYRSGQATVPPRPDQRWTGPFDDAWQAVDTLPAEELYFPPCGTNPNFNSYLALRLDAGTSDPATETSFADLDSIDGPYGVVYRLQTRPC